MKTFASKGIQIIYNLDIKPSKEDSPVRFAECDVQNPESVRSCIKEIAEDEGRIDILFASAGKFYLGDIEETSEEVFEDTPAPNLKGNWHTIHAVIPHMKKQGDGRLSLTVPIRAWWDDQNQRYMV